MARALAGQGRHVDAHPYAKEAARLGPNGELAAELIETMDRIVAQQEPPVRAVAPSARWSARRTPISRPATSISSRRRSPSPSWGITRAALAACEFRTDDESGIPVAPRALDAADRDPRPHRGADHPEAVLARIRALRIRDNAFIQIDTPPPLGLRYSHRGLRARVPGARRRPHRPSAILSYAR